VRVLIAGADGYLGWSLLLHLAARGYQVTGIDNGSRRERVRKVGSDSATPIASWEDRAKLALAHGADFLRADVATDPAIIANDVDHFKPDAVVQFAEIPSAPYSMIPGREWEVQQNNLASTWSIMNAIRKHAPDCHLVKLGTMGEYGTPNLPIPEGYAEMLVVNRRGPDATWSQLDTVPFPRQPGSFYHASKVHGTVNLALAAKTWGLACTDIMQGVVFGCETADMTHPDLLTRLDFDEYFGTAINRFCCQAVIGHPITVYGKGGQTRGFLPLADSMQCITLILENPAGAGEHRVVNQIEATYSVRELAHIVRREARNLGMPAEVAHIDNPRQEAEEHFYQVEAEKLRAMGYIPSTTVADEVRRMLITLAKHKDRIEKFRHVLVPQQHWSGEKIPCATT
jgi:nucleoside-diphosphate-sugar epimerase